MHFSACYFRHGCGDTEDLIVVISTAFEKQCMGDSFELK